MMGHKHGTAAERITLADYSRMFSDEYRASFNPFGNKPTLTEDGDCNNCPHLKSIGNKNKGVRISGGFGKCTRTTGPCVNPKVKLGIGGAKSSYVKEIERELCDEEGCEDRAECVAVPPSPDAVCIRNEKKAAAGRAKTAARKENGNG